MEYNKILVPLDGSKLAETVFPHVEKIAKGCAVPQVILITVTQPIHVKTPKGERIEQLPLKRESAIIYYGTPMSNVGGEIVPATATNSSIVFPSLGVPAIALFKLST